MILDDSVSRHHANISFENGQFFLNDVGSTTGTYIKITEQLVMEEDLIIEMGSN